MTVKSLPELVESIGRSPDPGWIRAKSITALSDLLVGYDYACMINGIDEPSLFMNGPLFEDWIALRTQCYRSQTERDENPEGWDWLLLLLNLYGNEETAFDKFFVFWNDYKKRTPRVVSRLTLDRTEPSRFAHLSAVAETKVVEFVKYTKDPGVFVRYIDDPESAVHERGRFFVNKRFARAHVHLLFSIRDFPGDVWESPDSPNNLTPKMSEETLWHGR